MQPNKFLYTFLLLVLLILSGTLGYHTIEGWTWLESIYMTAITLSTVGFSEVAPLSDIGKIFTLVLILSGVGGFAYMMGLIFQFTLDIRFDEIYGRKKMSKKIDELFNHTIICGFGKMGRKMASEIQKKNKSFVIIENDDSQEALLKDNKFLYIIGDASVNEVLINAGIHRAKSLVTVVTTDAQNVFITLSARSLNQDIFIISRVFDDSTSAKLTMAGANKIISPYNQAALKMAQSIINPAIDDFFEIIHDDKNLEFQMADFLIGKNMECTDKLLSEIKLKENGVLVVSIQKKNGKIIFAPHKTQTLEEGDRLIAIGSGNQLEGQLEQLFKVR